MPRNDAYLGSGNDKGSDECLTPRYVVLPLIKHLKEKGYKTVWCPFDLESSWYVRALRESGFTVIHTHIAEGGDFFLTNPKRWDVLVSNPPFSIKDKILKRCFELGKPFALLLPQNALQSIKRVNMYMDYGLEYLGFDRRPCFYTNGNLDKWPGSNHFASGYFCRGVLPERLNFEKLDPIQEPYFPEEETEKTKKKIKIKIKRG